MNWNYRVMEFRGADGESVFRAIHEVYYREDGTPCAYTQRPAAIRWDSDEGDGAPELILERIRECLAKPVLRPCDFPASGDSALPKGAPALAPPQGFESWLDYAVATSDAARDANIQSLFDPHPWGREISRDEIDAAIKAELQELRRRVGL